MAMSKEDYQIEERILDWVGKKSAPNSQYAYHRCIVCDMTWWDDERHERWCWLPGLKAAVARNSKLVFGEEHK